MHSMNHTNYNRNAILIHFISLYLQFIAQQFQLGSQSMNTNFSPFLQEMQECRQTMHNLRKKIYKNCRNTKYPTKKPKDNTEEIIAILENRKIPVFVTEALKKRRSFDIKSIKNISIAANLTLIDIQNRTCNQQREVENLFIDHKKRLQELKKKQQQRKIIGQVMYQISSDNIYYSTNEDECLRPIQAQLQISHSQPQQLFNVLYGNIQQRKQQPSDQKDYYQFNINESSLHQDLRFLNF